MILYCHDQFLVLMVMFDLFPHNLREEESFMSVLMQHGEQFAEANLIVILHL